MADRVSRESFSDNGNGVIKASMGILLIIVVGALVLFLGSKNYHSENSEDAYSSRKEDSVISLKKEIENNVKVGSLQEGVTYTFESKVSSKDQSLVTEKQVKFKVKDLKIYLVTD